MNNELKGALEEQTEQKKAHMLKNRIERFRGVYKRYLDCKSDEYKATGSIYYDWRDSERWSQAMTENDVLLEALTMAMLYMESDERYKQDE